eukprot:652328-Prorocentrum_minimum.AAC.1
MEFAPLFWRYCKCWCGGHEAKNPQVEGRVFAPSCQGAYWEDTVIYEYRDRIHMENSQLRIRKFSILACLYQYGLCHCASPSIASSDKPRSRQPKRPSTSIQQWTVEIHHATVDREHQDTLKAIAGMQAWTVSWSNVCDYYTPAEFHALARACSAAEDTVHYGYSMNWTRSVKGASSLDYFGNRVALEGLLDQANKAIEFTYKAHGLQDLLLSPPNNNIMNIADSVLVHLMHKSWVKGFFSFAGLRSYERQVGVVDVRPYSPLQRNSTNVYTIWTYDTSINFNQHQSTDDVHDMARLEQLAKELFTK